MKSICKTYIIIMCLCLFFLPLQIISQEINAEDDRGLNNGILISPNSNLQSATYNVFSTYLDKASNVMITSNHPGFIGTGAAALFTPLDNINSLAATESAGTAPFYAGYLSENSKAGRTPWSFLLYGSWQQETDEVMDFTAFDSGGVETKTVTEDDITTNYEWYTEQLNRTYTARTAYDTNLSMVFFKELKPLKFGVKTGFDISRGNLENPDKVSSSNSTSTNHYYYDKAASDSNKAPEPVLNYTIKNIKNGVYPEGKIQLELPLMLKTGRIKHGILLGGEFNWTNDGSLSSSDFTPATPKDIVTVTMYRDEDKAMLWDYTVDAGYTIQRKSAGVDNGTEWLLTMDSSVAFSHFPVQQKQRKLVTQDFTWQTVGTDEWETIAKFRDEKIWTTRYPGSFEVSADISARQGIYVKTGWSRMACKPTFNAEYQLTDMLRRETSQKITVIKNDKNGDADFNDVYLDGTGDLITTRTADITNTGGRYGHTVDGNITIPAAFILKTDKVSNIGKIMGLEEYGAAPQLPDILLGVEMKAGAVYTKMPGKTFKRTVKETVVDGKGNEISSSEQEPVIEKKVPAVDSLEWYLEPRFSTGFLMDVTESFLVTAVFEWEKAFQFDTFTLSGTITLP